MKTTSTTEQNHGRFGFPATLRHAVATAVIASTFIFGSPNIETGSAHTLPPCTGWSSAHQMSVRQPSVIRFRGMAGPMISRLYCRIRPGDPIHINYAVIDRRNV
jgi:hypothetical protein